MAQLFYEDVEVGSSQRFGEYAVTLGEIVRPAEESMFGGIGTTHRDRDDA